MSEQKLKDENEKTPAPYASQDELIRDYFELFDGLALKEKREEREGCRGPQDVKESVRRLRNEKVSKVKTKPSCPADDALAKEYGAERERLKTGEREDAMYTPSGKVMALEHRLVRRMGISLEKDETLLRFPVMKIKVRHKLDETEFRILLLLFRNEMFTFRWSDNRRCDRPVEILNLLFENKFEAARARKYFYHDSHLCKSKLIYVNERDEGLMRCSICLPEKVVREILGHRPPKGGEEDMRRRRFFGFRERQRREHKKFPVPKITFERVALKEKAKEEILRCLSQVRNEKMIFKTWGFSDVIAYGKGVTMLFAGEPGTGKTMTAHAVANYLNKKLLVADMTQIIDCYVGETEKNISRLFREAKDMKAVLFFDEADGMFYKRFESSRRAVDVAFNQAINVILQEIEKFDGVVILATNHSKGMDEALERRITLKVEFEVPDAPLRAKIWRTLIPQNAPLADDVDFETLAREFEFAGGHIKNVVLNAARFAVSRGEDAKITMQDLREAAQGELKGKVLFGKKNNRKVGFRKTGSL